LESKDITKVHLEHGVSVVDKRLHALDLVQSEFEVTLDEDKIDEEIKSAAEFRLDVTSVKVRALELIQALTDLEAGKVEDDAVSVVESVRPEAKLPKLSLPKFSGQVLEWYSFWDQFIAIIDQSDMPTISKFAYLKSLLEGEAAEVISGLTLTDQNYAAACDLLNQRFGRIELVRFSHIQELLNLSPLGRQASIVDLRKLHDNLMTHIRSLENLEIGGKQYGVFLTPLVLSCIPQPIRMEWARESAGREGDLDFLLKFLDKEIANRERCNTIRGLAKSDSSKVSSVKEIKKSSPKSSATALQAVSSQKTEKVSCNVCGKRHFTSKCFELVKAEHERRWEIVTSKRLCFRCLGTGHYSMNCSVSCSKCRGGHHFLLCKERPASEKSGSEKMSGAVTNVSHSGVAVRSEKSSTLMQVVTVNVCGQNGVVQANVLFDSGADRSYISSSLVRKVQPSFVGTDLVACATFGSSKAGQSKLRSVYSVDLEGLKQGSTKLVATEVDSVCAPVFRKRVPFDILKSFSHVELSQNYDVDSELSIDILIGLDYYWQLVLPEFVSGQKGIVAQKTVFGWILSGVYRDESVSPKVNVAHQLLCICDITDADVRNFWELDILSDKSAENSSVLRDFENQVSYEDGRYVVALPWTQPCRREELVDNFDLATYRLKSLMKKLDSNPDLKAGYNDALKEMEEKGFIEEVPSQELDGSNPVFYLPHRPVVRDSISTKIRPVFDASAKDVNGLSLNKLMEKGPNLIPNLCQILIRFRRWPVALVADIRKAFLQILVRKEDRDVHRFLWSLDGSVRIMRIVRVPFGNRSSPFLLNATIKYHLNRYETSHVISELKHNFYVDDWLSGADTVEEAKLMAEKATSILSEAGMTLTKWGSNCDVEEIAYSISDKSEDCNFMKVLGLSWNKSVDCFYFEGIEVPPELIVTKRVVLSFIARLFDPLGFLTPFVVRLKCLFQELWKLGLEWDSEVPEHLKIVVENWICDLIKLKNWKIPRPYGKGQWKNVASIELHGFGDASERAYGACVYIVVKQFDGSLSSSLVVSKSKVAPVKKVTLPRLELLGAVLATQLLELVCQALSLKIDCCFGWTDSSVTLSWIKSDPAKWKPFVANRVGEIQRATNPSQWSFCKGTENPADLVTRGISADRLMESELWLHGPSFLTGVNPGSDLLNTDCDDFLFEGVEVTDEIETSDLTLTVTSVDMVVDLNRFSSFQKSISVLGWVLRFIHNCRSAVQDRAVGDLSFSELENAKFCLIKQAQSQEFQKDIDKLKSGSTVSRKSSLNKLSPFLDDKGLLRVQSRLDFSSLSHDEKFPVIVPKGRLAELIVLFQHQLLKHAGVSLLISSLRNSYWIVGLRRLAKRVKRQCFQFQKLDSRACDQPMGPLPEQRVQQAAPFSVIGMDHAGPLYCSDVPGRKFYILLITCAVIRAVHLELVPSLGTEDCVRAFRKFVARRGMPSIVYSDNAKTFWAAKNQLQRMYGSLCPEWKFIVPRAPWWGGWWERLVKSVKSGLRKSVGCKSLSRQELETVLFEIEACINSRPLTSVGDSPQDQRPLTPAHFLIGRSGMFEFQRIEKPTEVNAQNLIDRKILQDSVMNQFWTIWSKDYLRNLPNVKGKEKHCDISIGSLVLIRDDDTLPRLTWPVGLVTELLPGKDGIIRTCRVRFRGSEYLRPIQKLHLLETSTVDCAVKDPVAITDTNVRKSRYGRIIKNVQKLNL
jgi:hypothetical protein